MSLPLHRPYKDGKGGVDIGLKPINEIEWLEIDSHFKEEISYKKKLYKDRKADVLVASTKSREVQQKTLDLILNHLTQYHSNAYEITSRYINIHESNDLYYFDEFENPLELASLLVQEDLILMQPTGDIFKLEAASLCAPTRWSLQEKFQQSLSDIHAEVPGYKERIDSRVNKIFSNMPNDKIFERFNWSIFDSPELFQPISSKSLVEIENILPNELYLRVERQSIRRLNESKTILFTVRVHVDPISSILTDKYLILDLLKALQNLDDEMKVYKVIKPFEKNLINWLRLKASYE